MMVFDEGPTGRLHGFTLIEVLISAAILVVLLASVGSLLVSSLRAYRANELVTTRVQDVESAVQVITYDLELAGLKGTDPAEFDDETRDFGGEPTLAIVKGATADDPDEFTVRYYEASDRLFGTSNPCSGYCEVTFRIGVDVGGTPVLFRIQGDGSATEQRGILRDMSNLKALGFLTRSGSTVDAVPGEDAPEATMSAVNIELTLANGDVWRFPVSVPNRQDVKVTSGG